MFQKPESIMSKYVHFAVAGIIVILIISLVVAIKKIEKLNGDSGKIIRDTMIVVEYDTITVNNPVYISETAIDTIFLPIRDTLRINDTLYQTLPITQRYYAKDSVYKAWVSGYRPNLDSIQVYPKTVFKTMTNTITRRPNKWGIGVSAGYGIMLNPVRASPFVGVSLNYNFIGF